ncbi:hypothetical protein K9K77_02835 [Candidatus Babeliales bacterium]|nr:hypothetical protein [Candidatus Babeliales bacterium]
MNKKLGVIVFSALMCGSSCGHEGSNSLWWESVKRLWSLDAHCKKEKIIKDLQEELQRARFHIEDLRFQQCGKEEALKKLSNANKDLSIKIVHYRNSAILSVIVAGIIVVKYSMDYYSSKNNKAHKEDEEMLELV